MRVLSLDELKELYHDYLLEIHKAWNKPGTHTDTAAQRISDTLYLWNHDDKVSYWKYLSGELDINKAHKLIREYLSENNATQDRQDAYCIMLDELKHYIDTQHGGIHKVLDDEHVEVYGKKELKPFQRLTSISAFDDNVFEYNYEALNTCFGASMTDTLQHATWNSKDGCEVWFPHLSFIKDGKYVSTASDSNWKNYFLDDYQTVIQMLYPGEPKNNKGDQADLPKTINPQHTFMKMKEKEYRYVGTYLFDVKYSTPRFQVKRRIKDSINLSIWASGRDTDYFDTSEIGKDVFKDIYIEHSFKKQKQYIAKFLEKKESLEKEENAFSQLKRGFVDRHSIRALSQIGDDGTYNAYIAELNEVLKNIFDYKISNDELKQKLGNINDFGQELVNIILEPEVCVVDKLRKSPWGIDLAAMLYTLYEENGEQYLYTLDEMTVDKMLFALGIKTEEGDDFVTKTSKLYFWSYCDDVIQAWSTYRFCQFLQFMAGVKKGNVKYVSSVKPDLRQRIEEEVRRQELEVEESKLDDAPETFEYNSVPRLREIEISSKNAKGSIVPRHADRKKNALVKANYCCEIDKNHPTFKRRNSDKNYTETHHLIPMEFSQNFKYTLDTEENIVSLCSNCHNQIHYGQGAEVLIKQLYNERKSVLEDAGLGTTVDGINIDINQLLHMYGY